MDSKDGDELGILLDFGTPSESPASGSPQGAPGWPRSDAEALTEGLCVLGSGGLSILFARFSASSRASVL